MQTTITTRRGDLARVTRLVDELAATHHLAPEIVADINVALDEVLTNVIAHGYDDGGIHEIWIRVTVDEEAIEAEILDDGKPFDPTAVPQPDLGGSLRERRVGGLGIHFMKNLMTEVTYARVGDRNRLLLKKRLTAGSEGGQHGPA